jgi:hypothetical protein
MSPVDETGEWFDSKFTTRKLNQRRSPEIIHVT